MKRIKGKSSNYRNIRMFIVITMLMSMSCTFKSTRLLSQVPTGYVLEDTLQGLYIPDDKNSEYLKINGASKETISLVFEMQFNDSIVIKLNDSIWISKRIQTNPILSMAEEIFELDLRRYKKAPTITILLPDVKKYIMFTPLQGYCIVYLNRINSSWSLAYSNYGKLYK